MHVRMRDGWKILHGLGPSPSCPPPRRTAAVNRCTMPVVLDGGRHAAYGHCIASADGAGGSDGTPASTSPAELVMVSQGTGMVPCMRFSARRKPERPSYRCACTQQTVYSYQGIPLTLAGLRWDREGRRCNERLADRRGEYRGGQRVRRGQRVRGNHSHVDAMENGARRGPPPRPAGGEMEGQRKRLQATGSPPSCSYSLRAARSTPLAPAS